MDYCASPIQYTYLIVISHSVWSAMKFWAKIRSPALKGITYLSNHATSIKNNFQSIARKEKHIETQKLKLKQQQISLNSSMTENQCIIKSQCKSQNVKTIFPEGEFLNQCFIEICKSLFSL